MSESEEEPTESVFDEEVKGVAIAAVVELVVGGREFLEALRSDAGEIAGEFSVFGEDHRSSGHEAVDQRLLPHLSQTQTLNVLERGERCGGNGRKIYE